MCDDAEMKGIRAAHRQERRHGRKKTRHGTPATTSLRVDVPTLVLWGMQDSALLPGQLDGLDDYAPNAVIVRIADGGHYPMRSHPALVNRAMREFIEHS